MVKKLFLTIATFLLLSYNANCSVKINELSTCNLSSVMNEGNYNFSNYIEFDTGGDSINLNGLLIIHYGKRAIKGKLEEKWRWVNDKDLIIGPYQVFWMDESTAKGHLPYKLDADGGSIVIYEAGVMIDSFAYDAMDADLAYGYKGEKLGYMIPTPGAKNKTAYSDFKISRCESPVFSHTGGVLEEPIELTIESPEGTDSIYYTTDGSRPSVSNGELYKKPIYIGSNTNIRSIAYKKGKMPSKISTASFIFEDEAHSEHGGFTIPIVSITVDSAYFYDDKVGICVIGTNGVRGEKDCTRTIANYNRDWKRPVHFEYIVDGKVVVSQEAEASVEGGCSRKEAIKSLAVKTTKKTGKDTFDYHFFASKPNVTHRALHIRNGGTAYNKVRFRDGLMQTFATEMNIDYQAYQPIAYYINGVYQGLMNLNERTNSDYLEANHDVEEDNLDLITLSDQLGIRASKGDKTGYDKLVKYLYKYETLDQETHYAGACAMMDMDEYVDYQIFQQFIVNTDWPGNNTKIWREKDNGRFRWMLFDTDFGLGLPSYEYLGGYSKNMIRWCMGEGTLQWANNREWMTTIFSDLSENQLFKRKFTTKFLIHLSTTFTEERINAVFDSITAMVDPEYQVTFGKSAVSATSSMRKFALNRPVNIYKHLMSYVKGTDTTSLEVKSEMEDAEIFLNGEKISYYKGKYFKGYELELIAKAPEGYEFAGWKYSSDTLVEPLADTTDRRYKVDGVLVGSLKQAGSITATFRPAGEPDTLPWLVINEVCAKTNGLSKFSDPADDFTPWIELYNKGDKSVDLSGYTISVTRNDSVVKQSTITTGYSSMIIGPKEHKVLWTKGDSIYGPQFLNFKLGKDTLSTICIARGDKEIVDCVDLISTNINESYGRESDGADEWVIFTTDPLEHNPSPNKKNGVKDTTGVNNTLPDLATVLLYPNPAQEYIHIQSTEKMERVSILDMTGRIDLQVYPKEEEYEVNIEKLETGIYTVEILTDKQVRRVRLIKGKN